jgi:hypothetical protein
MTIGEIIKKRVHELGGDGLVNLDSSCGCGDNDGWFPCDCPNTEECKPAKWIYCKSCEYNGRCLMQEEYGLGSEDADGCYVQIEQQEKMPNEQKCSFCDDCFTVITNDDAHICGACADSLKLERDRLMAEIAELKNDKPILCAECNDHILPNDEAICGVCANTKKSIITELMAENETLKAKALVWHKYPDEKPVNGGYYITYNGKNVEAHFWRGGAEYWADMASSEDDIIINKVHDITHWAYLPAPPEEES